MERLSDFKRALTIGSRWLRKHYREEHWEERTVHSVHSGYITFENPKVDGEPIRLDFPSAGNYEFRDGMVHIYRDGWADEPRKLVLQYKKV